MILLSQFICTNLALPVSIKCLSDSTAKLRETKSGCCQRVAKRALVQKLHNQPLYVIVALNMVTASKCHAFVTSQIHHKSYHTPSTQMQKCQSAKVAKCQSAKTPGARCHAYLTSHSILAPCLHNQTAVHHLHTVPLKSSLLELRVIYNADVP